MTNSRRKLKKERELISDIKKCFDNRCNNTDNCWECPFNKPDKECLTAYLEYLFNLIENEEEDYE